MTVKTFEEPNALATELNATIAKENPNVLAMLSDFGKRIFFPRGILAQAAEAKLNNAMGDRSRFNVDELSDLNKGGFDPVLQNILRQTELAKLGKVKTGHRAFHGDTNIRLSQSSRIVDAVADHDDFLALGLPPCDHGEFLFRSGAADGRLEEGRPSCPLGEFGRGMFNGRWIVSAEHLQAMTPIFQGK